jgi:spiro-SPASM protein
MNAIAVLFAGRLSPAALESLPPGRDALSLAVESARAFPGVAEVAILADETFAPPAAIGPVRIVRSPRWGKRGVLDALASLSEGTELVYYAWADSPLLDVELAGAIRSRHLRYAAEYSYADGWPYGFAPEVLHPSTAATLGRIAADDDGAVERDLLFSVLSKDINSFDIETEISPVDLRQYRLTLAADSKRNLILLRGLMSAGLSRAADAERVLKERPDLLRTVPAFYSIQVAGGCPQACSLCPYPRFGVDSAGRGVLERRDVMDAARFEALLDSIVELSGDAVIDISAWGESSLHPEVARLAAAVMERPGLSLLIETSGIGWKPGTIEAIAEAAARTGPRPNGMAAVSWIVSLDSSDPSRYAQVRGEGFAEATATAERLLALSPKDAYVQALRIRGEEEDLERFYRAWKLKTPNVIVQKHDDFTGFMPLLKATDLSPVKRRPCWHIMRDLVVLIDGTVPSCKEDLSKTRVLGNAFTEPLADIWEKGAALYASHAASEYPGICAKCDEYYTYNF